MHGSTSIVWFVPAGTQNFTFISVKRLAIKFPNSLIAHGISTRGGDLERSLPEQQLGFQQYFEWIRTAKVDLEESQDRVRTRSRQPANGYGHILTKGEFRQSPAFSHGSLPL
jgi:hypothetical protein